MEIINSLLQSGKSENVLKSLAWKSVCDIFSQKHPQTKISDFLISIRLQKKSLRIKINKPLLVSECQILQSSIQEDFSQKAKKLGFQEIPSLRFF